MGASSHINGLEPGNIGIPTPSYILRRRIILHLLNYYERGRFLEIGCGRGELLVHLARLGFDGIGLEISPEVVAAAREMVHPYNPKLSIVTDASLIEGEYFQYVFAFEVLEHIEDDAEALLSWRKWLAPGGRLVITVPARMKSWTSSDDAVGHYRRYERDALWGLIEDCGYKVEVFWSYGFPLTSLTRRFRSLFYRYRSDSFAYMTRQDRTLHSSQESIMNVQCMGLNASYLGSLVETLGLLCHTLQLPFRRFNLGDGYIVACRSANK